jgi:hypothetical protein
LPQRASGYALWCHDVSLGTVITRKSGGLKSDVRTLYQVIGLMKLKRTAIRADIARLNSEREDYRAFKGSRKAWLELGRVS